MSRIVIAHCGERVRESAFLLGVKAGSRCEHAVIVGWRRPDLAKTTFRHEALVLRGVPETVTNGAGVGSPVENGTDHFDFAGPGVAVFADVAVKAQCAIVPA